MKTTLRLFRMDLKRAILHKTFWIACAAMLLVILLSGYWMIRQPEMSVVELSENVLNATAGSTLVLWMFPLLPFALTYAQDSRSNALKYVEIRSIRRSRVLVVRFLVSCLSAFLSVMVTFFIFFLVMRISGHALVNWQIYELNPNYEGYYEMLTHKNAIGFLAMYVIDRGLSSVLMAACAFFISVWSRDPFITFSAPVCIYFLVLRFFSFIPDQVMLEQPYLDPVTWLESSYSAPGGAWISLAVKFGVALLVGGLYLTVTLLLVRRRGKKE